MSNPNPNNLPNPNTPLAFLAPDLANQFEVSRYLYAITLGAYMWDIAVNLSSDYKLLFKHRIRFPTIAYYASRVFTLAYIITSFVFQVGSVSNCNALQISLGICNTLAQSSTAMLFLLRALAVWKNNEYVRGMLCFAWLGLFGCVMVTPIGIRGAHIGTTMQCINVVAQVWEEAGPISAVIFDSIIFSSIAYRILTNGVMEDGARPRLQTFFGLRNTIPRLSAALLRGGQKYYLFAVSWNVVVIVLVGSQSLPPVYRVMCSIPATATQSAMACLVFRQIIFGLTEADGSPTVHTSNGYSLPGPSYARKGPNRPQLSNLSSGSTAIGFEGSVASSEPAIPLKVRVLKDQVQSYDHCLGKHLEAGNDQ
ncbi:hypothetical protein BT96DRAFT_925307 [Gymnopus androsaceus JB14]|uniref:Transmembrane protein n=1 Tax=Gymnopus androsaceus JB14 TaxID=1447944 RepID=A0A6A4H184_9AGAR|nr:hypothetical protein BT96DRAFT_925307 [Gymnopus androsaceus JB14]